MGRLLGEEGHLKLKCFFPECTVPLLVEITHRVQMEISLSFSLLAIPLISVVQPVRLPVFYSNS